MQPVGGDAEADRDEPEQHAGRDARGPGGARREERPGQRDRDDHGDTQERGCRTGHGEVEEVERDECEAGQQERSLEASDALAEGRIHA